MVAGRWTRRRGAHTLALVNSPNSPTFHFLASHDHLLVRYATLAEQAFQSDPEACLIRLRRQAEALASQAAVIEHAYAATTQIVLDEASTRRLIDAQLRVETVVDRKALGTGACQARGDFKTIGRVFEVRLAELLGELQQAVWEKAG